MAAFAAPYAASPSAGRVDSPELTFRMTPPRPASTSVWASARAHAAVTSRFCATTSCTYSSSWSRAGRAGRPARLPTLFTATSRPPSPATVRSTMPRRCTVSAEVELDAHRERAGPLGLGHRVGELGAVPVDQRDVAARLGEAAGGGPADAGRGAGHERPSPGEAEVDHGSRTTLIAPDARSAATRNASGASSSGNRCVISVAATSGSPASSAAASSRSRPPGCEP